MAIRKPLSRTRICDRRMGLAYRSRTMITILTVMGALTVTAEPLPQDKSRKRTVKYFKTQLHRSELLKDEVDAIDSKDINHFRAIYDHKGRLIRVEFIPNGDRLARKMKKRELFPKPKPPFRFYEDWNPHTRGLKKRIPTAKVGDRPYFRVSYADTAHIRSVESFLRRNQKLWSYFLLWDEEFKQSQLSVVFSVQQPITTLDPHLFHPTASEMKPGWIADFRHNVLDRPLSVQVRDDVGNVYYFYRFKHRFEDVGDSLKAVTHRITTSEYYRADSSYIGKHELRYTAGNVLLEKKFYDAQNKLTETIEYEYYPKLSEVAVIIRDPKGNILHREVRKR